MVKLLTTIWCAYLCAAMLSACAPAAVSRSNGTDKIDFGAYGPKRIADEEAGVVCYYLIEKGGISCLPISDTQLGKK